MEETSFNDEHQDITLVPSRPQAEKNTSHQNIHNGFVFTAPPTDNNQEELHSFISHDVVATINRSSRFLTCLLSCLKSTVLCKPCFLCVRLFIFTIAITSFVLTVLALKDEQKAYTFITFVIQLPLLIYFAIEMKMNWRRRRYVILEVLYCILALFQCMFVFWALLVMRSAFLSIRTSTDEEEE